MAKVTLGGTPTSPPPDPKKPYLWVGDKWVLLISDTLDGVPESLDSLGGTDKTNK